ncbi:AbfB domain-containing protein [Actinoplanes sp. NPDC049596]|uniref:AbfB domain-containing protein n=1 Tax=unclassified Actinoplanes TaxID=2626549 RepID=UPI0034209CD4
MTENDENAGVPIGGWGPYRDGPAERAPQSPRQVPPLADPPRPLLARSALIAAIAGAKSPADGGSALRGRRALLAAAAGLLIAIAGGAALALRDDDPALPPVAQQEVVPPFTPAAPVSIQPSPTSPSASPPPPPAAPPAEPVSRSTTPAERATTKPPATTPPTTKPPAPALIPGATIGLEAADQSGRRLRHRDYRARVEVIRTEAGRADSRFTVRSGLAGHGCVSLESVNFPGHFLRHRNFILRLDRQDDSPLFRLDATFCPRSLGSSLVLESTNYPGQFLVADERGVYLAEVPPAQATAFVVKTPL